MRLRVNERDVEVASHPMKRLLDVLREDLALTGTKEGCGEGECGACTVLIDGEPVCACLVPVAQAEGTVVTTIEGLGGEHPLQLAFTEYGGAQCGICTPGMIMAALAIEDPGDVRGLDASCDFLNALAADQYIGVADITFVNKARVRNQQASQ